MTTDKRQRQVNLTKKRKLDQIVKLIKEYGFSVQEVEEHFKVYKTSKELIEQKRQEMLTIKKRRESLQKAREARKAKVEAKKNG